MNQSNNVLGSLSAKRELVILSFISQYSDELVPDYEILRYLDENGYWDDYRYNLRDLIIPDLKVYGFIEVLEFDGHSHVEIDPFTTSKGWWQIKITDAGKEYLIANR